MYVCVLIRSRHGTNAGAHAHTGTYVQAVGICWNEMPRDQTPSFRVMDRIKPDQRRPQMPHHAIHHRGKSCGCVKGSKLVKHAGYALADAHGLQLAAARSWHNTSEERQAQWRDRKHHSKHTCLWH